MSGIPYVVTVAAALGCGLMAGVYFTFSTFIMVALKQLPASQGVTAMQSINVKAVNPLFMLALFGTGVLCLGTASWALIASGDQPQALLVGGSAIYLVGSILITIVGNVPMNNRLAGLDAEEPESAGYWEHYVARWTNLNHLRTLASLIATVMLAMALGQ